MFAFGLSSCSPDKSWAQLQAPAQSRATLVIFTERPMRENQWADLLEALQRATSRESAHLPALGDAPDLVRGDRIVHGMQVERPITVYLRGDCRLIPMPEYEPAGVLGWVYRVHGKIAPLIHVNCGGIAQELGPVALGLDRKRCDVVMSEALARVIVHEWVHVATQNAGHAREGVTKSSFGIADLLAADDAIWRDPRLALRKRPEL